MSFLVFTIGYTFVKNKIMKKINLIKEVLDIAFKLLSVMKMIKYVFF